MAFPGWSITWASTRTSSSAFKSSQNVFDDEPQKQTSLINKTLLQFLKDWLNHHILIEDMAYRPLAEDNPEALKAAKNFKPTEVWWGGRASA